MTEFTTAVKGMLGQLAIRILSQRNSAQDATAGCAPAVSEQLIDAMYDTVVGYNVQFLEPSLRTTAAAFAAHVEKLNIHGRTVEGRRIAQLLAAMSRTDEHMLSTAGYLSLILSLEGKPGPAWRVADYETAHMGAGVRNVDTSLPIPALDACDLREWREEYDADSSDIDEWSVADSSISGVNSEAPERFAAGETQEVGERGDTDVESVYGTVPLFEESWLTRPASRGAVPDASAPLAAVLGVILGADEHPLLEHYAEPLYEMDVVSNFLLHLDFLKQQNASVGAMQGLFQRCRHCLRGQLPAFQAVRLRRTWSPGGAVRNEMTYETCLSRILQAINKIRWLESVCKTLQGGTSWQRKLLDVLASCDSRLARTGLLHMCHPDVQMLGPTCVQAALELQRTLRVLREDLQKHVEGLLCHPLRVLAFKSQLEELLERVEQVFSVAAAAWTSIGPVVCEPRQTEAVDVVVGSFITSWSSETTWHEADAQTIAPFVHALVQAMTQPAGRASVMLDNLASLVMRTSTCSSSSIGFLEGGRSWDCSEMYFSICKGYLMQLDGFMDEQQMSTMAHAELPFRTVECVQAYARHFCNLYKSLSLSLRGCNKEPSAPAPQAGNCISPSELLQSTLTTTLVSHTIASTPVGPALWKDEGEILLLVRSCPSVVATAFTAAKTLSHIADLRSMRRALRSFNPKASFGDSLENIMGKIYLQGSSRPQAEASVQLLLVHPRLATDTVRITDPILYTRSEPYAADTHANVESVQSQTDQVGHVPPSVASALVSATAKPVLGRGIQPLPGIKRSAWWDIDAQVDVKKQQELLSTRKRPQRRHGRSKHLRRAALDGMNMETIDEAASESDEEPGLASVMPEHDGVEACVAGAQPRASTPSDVFSSSSQVQQNLSEQFAGAVTSPHEAAGHSAQSASYTPIATPSKMKHVEDAQASKHQGAEARAKLMLPLDILIGKQEKQLLHVQRATRPVLVPGGQDVSSSQLVLALRACISASIETCWKTDALTFCNYVRDQGMMEQLWGYRAVYLLQSAGELTPFTDSLFSALDARNSALYQNSHKLTMMLRSCWDLAQQGRSFSEGVNSLFSIIPSKGVSVYFEGHGLVECAETLLRGLTVVFKVPEAVATVVGRSCFSCYNEAFGFLLRLRWTNTHLNAQMCESRRAYEQFNTALRTHCAQLLPMWSAKGALHKLLCALQRMHLFGHTVHDRICSSVLSEDWPILVASVANASHPLAIRHAHDNYTQNFRQRCLQLPQQTMALSFLLRLYDRVDQFLGRFHEFYTALMHACAELETAQQQEELADGILSAVLRRPGTPPEKHKRKSALSHSTPPPAVIATASAAVAPLRRIFAQCAALSRAFDSQLRLLTRTVEAAEADSALKSVVIALNYNGYYDSDLDERNIYDWIDFS